MHAHINITSIEHYQSDLLNETLTENLMLRTMAHPTPERLLSYKHPEIAKEWDYEKNGNLNPNEVTYGSGKKVWWLCDKNHSYAATVSNRSLGKGCPYCAGQKVSPEMSLAKTNEQLASEWHPTLNGSLTPTDFLPHSHKKIWWKCPNFAEHEWQATIASRSKGSGCPHCNNQTSLPELRIFCELKHYYPATENRLKVHGKEADIFIPSLNLAIEYDGSYYHSNKEKEDAKKGKHFAQKGTKLIRVRAKPLEVTSANDVSVPERELTKLDLNTVILKVIEVVPSAEAKLKPYTELENFAADDEYLRYVSYLPNPFPENSLEHLRPELVREWDEVRNAPLTPRNFTVGSNKLVWWKCPKNSEHNYEATIASRNRRGCPYCASKQISDEMTLQAQHPEIAVEWDIGKNHPKKPSDVLAKSNKNYYWICPKGHSYCSTVSSRTHYGRGCPVCKDDEIKKRSIGSLYPQLVVEWHPTKNDETDVYHVLPKSQKKRWWICEHGHEWQAIVATRTDGTGCPVCSGRNPDSMQNFASDYPELANEYDKTLNSKPAFSFKSGSGKKVWWRCSKNPEHIWEAQIYSRTKLGTGCPLCWKEKRQAK